jgi:hypothetical protein
MQNAALRDDDDFLSSLGHNNPPDEMAVLVDDLATRNSEIIGRAEELIASADRAPATCVDEATAGKLSDLVKLLNASRKALDAQRAAEKEPYRKKGDTVHGFFVGFMDKIDAKVAALKKPLADYLKLKAEEERRAAAEEAERARQESQRQAEAAQRHEQAHRDSDAAAALDAAVVAEQNAAAAQKVAQAKPADLASTRGSYGSRGGLSTRWVGTIESRAELDLEALRPYFGTDDLQKAVNAFVKANCKGETGATLKGTKIEQQTNAVVR